MKKIFFKFHNLFTKRNNSYFFCLWFIVHIGVLAILGISLFFAPPLRLSTLITDLFPQADTAKIAEADNILTEKNSREAIILFASPVFEKAKNTAVSFYNKFKNESEVESASLLFDSDVMAEIADFYFKHRFVIAGTNTIDLLESGKAEEVAMDALVMAYGAMNYVPLTQIDKDPFLLTERGVREFLSSSLTSAGSMNIKDDVLSVQKDGIWYVILRMTLSSEAVSVINIENNIIGDFYKEVKRIKEAEQNAENSAEVPAESLIEFYFSGAPFHGYESASNAQKEVTVIGTVSLAFVILLLLSVFRSPIPVIFSGMDIIFSLILGTAATFLIFREIHVFTFIFGTVLIGICIDYSIHYFINWKGNADLKSGSEIRSHISKSMIMCFLSSAICCSAIIFAPLPIFKQFGVFAIAGLLSSFLTAYCIYPILRLPKEEKRRLILPQLKILQRIKFSFTPTFRIMSVVILTAIIGIILYFNPQGLQINNDLGTLYTMPPHLLESEMRTAEVLDQGEMPLYFIISGNSAEETLRNEEQLILRLEKEVADGNLGSFMGTSMNTPSLNKQEKTYKAMSSLLPLAGLQYEYLGFPRDYTEIFFNEYSVGNNYVLPEDAPSWAGVTNLWIGKVKENFYSCLMLFHAKDRSLFMTIADDYDFVYLINMEEILNRDFNTLTHTIVLFFFAAFFIVAVIIFIIYPVKDSIKICIVPVLVVLSVMAVLAVLKIHLGFLPITASILVFGLGIDFMLYMTGSKKGKHHNLTRTAVFFSFLTTIISFGLLSLSSFTPVYIFGVTIASGLVAAFIFTMLLQWKTE